MKLRTGKDFYQNPARLLKRINIVTIFTCREAARDEAQFLANQTGKAHIMRYCKKRKIYLIFQMGTKNGPIARAQKRFFTEDAYSNRTEQKTQHITTREGRSVGGL